MSSTGNLILAIMWILASPLWFFTTNPVMGIIWLCAGIAELIIGWIRRSKEKEEHERRRIQTMRFKGKVAGWFYGIMAGVAMVLIPLIITSAFIHTNVTVLMINLLVLAAIELFCISILFHNFVELQNETLLIVFGFIKKEISYSEIAALEATTNPTSSLAASLDRIEIKCKSKSSMLISVMDKERFFNEMKKYNPKIIIM